MQLKLKNWKLAVIALIFIVLFTSLGFWQLSRAKFKKILLKSFTARTLREPLSAQQLTTNDYRFYRAKIAGEFDNQHVFLLDNKTFHGKIGYEVYIPFIADGLKQAILVDLGFIEMNSYRNKLPTIMPLLGHITIIGMLNLPPSYFALGQMQESKQTNWPLRIEFINLNEMSKLLNYPLFTYLLSLEPQSSQAFAMEWQASTMSPEKHLGYAVQWFALALTLLILCVVLNSR